MSELFRYRVFEVESWDSQVDIKFLSFTNRLMANLHKSWQFTHLGVQEMTDAKHSALS